MLADTRALVTRYQRALADLSGQPELTERLNAIQQAHLDHVAALSALVHGTPPPGTPPGRGKWSSPLVSPRPSGSTGAAEVDVSELLAQLREREQDARDRVAQACLSAPPARAALLGSITAARATHVEVLV